MIDIKNLNVFYDKTKILSDINLHIEKGQKVAILGANGSGKTTLLNSILNIIDYKGYIGIDNIDIKNIKRKDFAKKVGILNQINNINFDFTVFDTVMLGRYVYQKDNFFMQDSKKDIEEVEKDLSVVNMLDFKDRSILSLSGGQRQRVFFARLLAQNPDIVLLDEPTNHLDFKYQIELIEFLNIWNKEQNKTIIGVLHDINLANMLTEDMVVMQDGKILEFSSFKEILEKGILNKIYDIDIRKYMLESLGKWK